MNIVTECYQIEQGNGPLAKSIVSQMEYKLSRENHPCTHEQIAVSV